jgi:DNA-binding IclR family transcriptional regulator
MPTSSALDAQSIADITGIPREAARRKLAALARAALVQKRPDGSWFLTPSDGGGACARRDLQDITGTAASELARLSGWLAVQAEAAAACAEAAAPAPPS